MSPPTKGRILPGAGDPFGSIEQKVILVLFLQGLKDTKLVFVKIEQYCSSVGKRLYPSKNKEALLSKNRIFICKESLQQI